MISHSAKRSLAFVARRVAGGVAILVYAVLVAAAIDAAEDSRHAAHSEPARRVVEIIRALRPAGAEAPLTSLQSSPEGWPLWPADDHARATR